VTGYWRGSLVRTLGRRRKRRVRIRVSHPPFRRRGLTGEFCGV
jgi:hypothetical protein